MEQVKQTRMEVVLEGIVTEFEAKFDKSIVKTEGHALLGKENPYVRIKGVVQFGEHNAESKRFEKYIAQYTKAGKEHGGYQKMVTFAKNVKSKDSLKEGEIASTIRLKCELKENFYTSQSGTFIEGEKIEVVFVEDLKGTNKGEASLKGRIISIVKEVKNDEETGRLIVNMFGVDYMSNAVKTKFIVDETLAEQFEEAYEVGCTAEFYVDYRLHKGEETVITGSGLGVQRVTEGKSYVEAILVGATSPIDEDTAGAISNVVAKELLSKRNAEIQKKKEGNTSSTPVENVKREGLAPKAKAPIIEEDNDDEFPF